MNVLNLVLVIFLTSCSLPKFGHQASLTGEDSQAAEQKLNEPTPVLATQVDKMKKCLQFAKIPVKSIMGPQADRRCGGPSTCTGSSCSGNIKMAIGTSCHDESGHRGTCQAINPALYANPKNYDGQYYLCLCVPKPKVHEMKSVVEKLVPNPNPNSNPNSNPKETKSVLEKQ
jgi:hypothetical protein